MRRFAFVILAASFLAGCVPWVGSYYFPSSAAGELIYSSCVGQTHIPRGIRFVARDRTKVETALVQYRDTRYLQIVIAPARSSVVQLREHAAQLYIGESTQGRKVAFDSISLVDPIYLQVPNAWTMEIDKPMKGERLRVGNFEHDRNYWLTSRLADSGADSIRVVLPELAVDGESVRFPEIRFEKEARPVLVVWNC